MPTISLTLPTAGTVITAGLHATNLTTLLTLLNGGLDSANWASGKIFAPSKLTQEGATAGQVLAWDSGSSTWKPATQTGAPGYATTLPGSPTDGQEAVLVDSITLPTYAWRFRWNAGSSHADKWEWIGGSPGFSEVTTSEATTASDTYQALATAGPSFALPRAGVYDIEIGFRGIDQNNFRRMSYDIGGTGAVDADSAVQGTASGSQFEASAARSRRKTGLTAVTLTAKYRPGGAAARSFADRWMRVTPVRVS